MIAESSTQEIVHAHLAALGSADVDAVMAHYHPDAVLISVAGTFRGSAAIEAFFRQMLAATPPEFLQNFRLTQETFDGDLGYIVWQALPFAPLGTDTFIVRDGKIVQQTFAAFMPGLE